MTTADLLSAADERDATILRLMLAFRLSRPEAEYMLEHYGDDPQGAEDVA